MRPHTDPPTVRLAVLGLALAIGARAAVAWPGDASGGAPRVGALEVAVTPSPLPEAYGLVAEWLPETPTGMKLFHPTGIAFDGRGNIVLTESGNGRLTRASARGTEPDSLIDTNPPDRLGTSGRDPGQFLEPEDVAVSSVSDRLYVADTGNRRVQVVTLDGALIAVWTDVGLPRGIAVGPAPGAVAGGADRVYVSDAESGVVRVFGPDGSAMGVWPLADPAAPTEGQRPLPLGLSVTPTGDLVVADHANQRIVWLDADGSAGDPGALAGWLPLDNTTGPGGAPTDAGVAANGDLFVAVSRGVLRYRGSGQTGAGGAGVGTAAGLEYAETWPVLRNELPSSCLERGCATPNCTPLAVEERDSLEGVQRLDVRPGAGLVVTYAPELRWLDRVVVYPALPGGGVSPPRYGEG
jgi:hypothetical protein